MTDQILPAANVRLAARAASRDDAIREAGTILVDAATADELHALLSEVNEP